MTHSRQSLEPTDRLDELLGSQPLPIGEPTSAEWATKLEQIMQRVRAVPTASATLARDVAGVDVTGVDVTGVDVTGVDDLLRTPLPVESAEPEPSDPFAFESEAGAVYDALRAPLKSGEHAPVRMVVDTANGRAPGHANALGARPSTTNTRRSFIVVAAGALAAAAAVVVMQRPPSKELASRPVEAVPFERAAPAAVESIATPLASVAVAASPKTEDLPIEAEPAASPEQALALNAGLSQQGNHAAAAPASAAKIAGKAAVNAAADPDEPELTPAAGPSNLVDHPSTGAISAALARRLAEAQRCLPEAVPSTRAHLTFQSNGTIQKVELRDPALGDNVQACLRQALGAVRVEPFARDHFDVNATISQPANPKARGN